MCILSPGDNKNRLFVMSISGKIDVHLEKWKEAHHLILCIILFLQAYYREGVALQALGKDAEALASLASGLAADPKSTQLLTAMVETAIRSPLKGTSQDH